MNYSMYLLVATATLGRSDSPQQTLPDLDEQQALEPALRRLCQLLRDFVEQPVSPQTAYALEQQLQEQLREAGRLGLEWALNRLEPPEVKALPAHVESEAGLHTRINRKTPQEVATVFGTIRWQRVGYRPTDKSGPTIFPLLRQLGITAGATPALAERAARYQAEAGATQRRTLQRLQQEHGVNWGVKKLRQVIERVSESMTGQRHEVQVEQLLEWLEQAASSTGRHKPVLRSACPSGGARSTRWPVPAP